MKIPQALHKFANPSLIVVTAKRQAQIYYALGDAIELADDFKVNPPRYTDREGFFGKRMGGKFLGSGAVYEKKKEKLEHEFVPEFLKHLKAALDQTGARDLYIFLPAYQTQFIFSALPKNISAKIRLVIKQNHVGRKPLEIIKKLAASMPKLVIKPEKPEVTKLLRRPFFRASFSA